MKLLDGTDLNFKRVEDIWIKEISIYLIYKDKKHTIVDGSGVRYFFCDKNNEEDLFILVFELSKEGLDHRCNRAETDLLLPEEERGFGWSCAKEMAQLIFLMTRFDLFELKEIKNILLKRVTKEEYEKLTHIKNVVTGDWDKENKKWIKKEEVIV